MVSFDYVGPPCLSTIPPPLPPFTGVRRGWRVRRSTNRPKAMAIKAVSAIVGGVSCGAGICYSVRCYVVNNNTVTYV